MWFSPSVAETYYPGCSVCGSRALTVTIVRVHYAVSNAVNYRCREVIVGASATAVTQSSYPGCLVWAQVLIWACQLELTNQHFPPCGCADASEDPADQ